MIALVAGAFAHSVPWPAVGWVASCSLAGHLVLYGWIRRGVRAPRTPGNDFDASAFVHLLLSLGLLALACTLHAPVGGVALQLMFVMIAFDIHRLSRRQALYVAIAGFGTAGLSLEVGHEAVRLVDVIVTGGCMAVLITLGHRMRYVQARQRNQRVALSAALLQWRNLSHHDALTGALARRHGSELLESEVDRQKRDGRPFSIGLLDVDHFKRINDAHGHELGDAVLIALVRLAGEAMGEPHKVVRWGGEEFLLLMPATDVTNAVRLLGTLRERIVAHDWSRCASGLVVDVSIGVTEHRPGDTLDATVAHADAALYIAKAEGRGRVVQDRR